MIDEVKAELRKVLTVRSTYVIFAFALVMLGIFAFYVEGFRGSDMASSPMFLGYEATQAISSTAVLASITAALLVTHEYRYNTILYTFTTSRSRIRVFVAKMLVITFYVLLFSAVIAVLSPLFARIGLALGHHTLVPQTIYYRDLIWRCLFAGWGFSMMALLFATLIRNQVGAMAAIFLFPGTVEPLLGMLLKKNSAYLPYESLGQVIDTAGRPLFTPMSPGHAAMIFLAYVVGGWLIAFFLLKRRDAN